MQVVLDARVLRGVLRVVRREGLRDGELPVGAVVPVVAHPPGVADPLPPEQPQPLGAVGRRGGQLPFGVRVAEQLRRGPGRPGAGHEPDPPPPPVGRLAWVVALPEQPQPGAGPRRAGVLVDAGPVDDRRAGLPAATVGVPLGPDVPPVPAVGMVGDEDRPVAVRCSRGLAVVGEVHRGQLGDGPGPGRVAGDPPQVQPLGGFVRATLCTYSLVRWVQPVTRATVALTASSAPTDR